MESEEELRAQFKKANQQATALKMDLHDLAEELPTDWEKIPEISQKAYEAFSALAEIKKRMGKT